MERVSVRFDWRTVLLRAHLSLLRCFSLPMRRNCLLWTEAIFSFHSVFFLLFDFTKEAIPQKLNKSILKVSDQFHSTKGGGISHQPQYLRSLASRIRVLVALTLPASRCAREARDAVHSLPPSFQRKRERVRRD